MTPPDTESARPSPPEVPVVTTRKSLLSRISVVWVVPFLALVIALGVAWNTWMERGPLIVISFDSASGVHANETELRYRDVTVGLVEKVAFSDGLDRVLVSVRLDRNVAPYVDGEARFFVVRPEVTSQGVSGLETVLSGVYIEGIWDTEPGGLAENFEGLSEAPLGRGTREGLQLVLRATGDTGVTENAPIIFRGIEVGRVGRARIADDGSTAIADALIYAPHDRLITSATRFWDTSGFSFKLGANGAELDFSSIASLVSGGVTFATVVSGGEAVEDGAEFGIYADEGAARNSLFGADEGDALELTAIFDDNVSGLSVDAPVDLGGLRVGRVTGLNGLVDPDRFGDREVRLAVTMTILPGRLGLSADADAGPDGGPGSTGIAETAGADAALEFLAARVRGGLRARLATASIFTGGLKIELLDVADAPPAELDLQARPNPVIPTTEGDIADVAATAAGVFERINALPIEEVLASVIDLMDNASALISSAEIRQVPVDLSALLSDARGVVGSEAVQALPARLDGAVNELQVLLGALNEQQAAARLLTALDKTAEAANGVVASVEGLPGLIARLDEVAANAAEVPLAQLSADLDAVLTSADALIGSEAAAQLPDALDAALREIRSLVGQLNADGASRRLLAAVDSAAQAADGLRDSVRGLPDLVARIDAIAAKAETVPLDRLATDLESLMQSADALIGTDAARALPGALGASLDELRQALAELRQGGVIENANGALAAASGAANRIAEATEALPALVQRINTLLAQAGSTLDGYQAQSGLGRDARAALREVQEAAKAVSSLARALERRPNSILIGR